MKHLSFTFFLVTLVLGSAWAESSAQNSTARDHEIERLIREKIYLDGAVSADAKKILVRSANGRVTLSGTVDSDFDKAAVEKIASGYVGADVADELMVDSHE